MSSINIFYLKNNNKNEGQKWFLMKIECADLTLYECFRLVQNLLLLHLYSVVASQKFDE